MVAPIPMRSGPGQGRRQVLGVPSVRLPLGGGGGGGGCMRVWIACGSSRVWSSYQSCSLWPLPPPDAAFTAHTSAATQLLSPARALGTRHTFWMGSCSVMNSMPSPQPNLDKNEG